jgi:transposase
LDNLLIDVTYKKKKHFPTIRKIPDDLWDEIRLILPPEKSNKSIGRPVVPFRKVLDGILYVLRTGCQWKMLPKEYGSGSTTCHIDDFRNGQYLKYFTDYGLDY